jgi:hypothetical protein
MIGFIRIYGVRAVKLLDECPDQVDAGFDAQASLLRLTVGLPHVRSSNDGEHQAGWLPGDSDDADSAWLGAFPHAQNIGALRHQCVTETVGKTHPERWTG